MAQRAELRLRPTPSASRLAQLFRFQRLPALVALVAPGLLRTAVWTPAQDVSVGEGALLAGAPCGGLRALIDVSTPVQPEEQTLHGPLVSVGVCLGVEVEGDAEPPERGGDRLVLLIRELRRIHPGPFGGHGDRRAVLIGAGDHQHVVPGQAVIAGHDVGGQVAPRQVAEMARTGRVWPGHRDQHPHRSPPLLSSRSETDPRNEKGPTPVGPEVACRAETLGAGPHVGARHRHVAPSGRHRRNHTRLSPPVRRWGGASRRPGRRTRPG